MSGTGQTDPDFPYPFLLRAEAVEAIGLST